MPANDPREPRSNRPVRRLEDEITLLRNKLLKMVDLVDEQCANAITALLERDTELATDVIERDNEIDEMELEVDDICERILALHQPVAVDLRLIITAIKVNTDLERIGDHCKNLAKGTGHLTRYRNVLPETYIEEMAESVRSMLQVALAAFVQQDEEKAREVLASDQHIDMLHLKNFIALSKLSEDEPHLSEATAHLITISKALERISDHATNIAEDIVFLIEGIDIRHSGLTT